MRGLTDEEYRVLSIGLAEGEKSLPSRDECAVLDALTERRLFIRDEVYRGRGWTTMTWNVTRLGRIAHRVETAFRARGIR